MSYIAVVSHTPQDLITKYSEFPTKAEAENHAATYGGFAAKIPVGGGMPNLAVSGAAVVIITRPPPPAEPPVPDIPSSAAVTVLELRNTVNNILLVLRDAGILER